MDVKSLASSLDSYNKRRITSLENQLDITREIYKLSIAKRTLYLTEQYKIAKELGMENNPKNFFPNLIFPISKEIPQSQHYFRGFKAIDKELQLLKERSQQDKDLMADGYVQIKEELLIVENDNTPNALRDAANVIINDDINSWVNFNFEFAEIKNLKQSKLFIFLSTIIGIIIGTLGVLLANAIKNIKKTTK